MSLYLISGLPGTGKTVIGHELANRGFEVVNADKEFGYYGHVMSETPVTIPRRLTRQWYAENGWMWDGIKMRSLLEQARDSPLIISGNALNENKFYRYFDKIFLLHVPDELIIMRLKEYDDPYVNNPDFIKRMRIWNLATLDHAKNIKAIVIESARPVAEVVDAMIQDIKDHDAR